MLSITINEQYYNKWNDNIQFIVYANEACRHYAHTTHVNLNGSKRKLILSLLEPSVVSDEAAFIITNIANIREIEILEQSSEMFITTDNKDNIEIKGISNFFIETIKKL